MARYIKRIECPKGIMGNSAIAFILDNGEVIKETIIKETDGFFTTAWALFDRIGLKDPIKFFSDIVGPENVSRGSWPYVRGEDNMHRVLNALSHYRADRIPESQKVVISDDGKKPFTLSVRSKRRLTLDFKL